MAEDARRINPVSQRRRHFRAGTPVYPLKNTGFPDGQRPRGAEIVAQYDRPQCERMIGIGRRSAGIGPPGQTLAEIMETGAGPARVASRRPARAPGCVRAPFATHAPRTEGATGPLTSGRAGTPSSITATRCPARGPEHPRSDSTHAVSATAAYRDGFTRCRTLLLSEAIAAPSDSVRESPSAGSASPIGPRIALRPCNTPC